MSPRERRLRERIDVLSDRLAAAQSRKGRRGAAMRRCLYCGRKCKGVACFAHSDLLELDPNYEVA